MARKARAEVEGGLYHVITRGNNRRSIFHAPADYDKFLSLVGVQKTKLPFFLYAYCLMSNHVHLLIERQADKVGRIMHRLLTGYAQYYNRRYKRLGHLLQGRHKAILCESERYLAELVRYIHLNPVRAGMVNQPEDYPYSSHRAYLGVEPCGMVDVDPVLRHFGARRQRAREAYQEFVRAGIEQGHRLEFYPADEGRILGTEEFVDATIHRLGEVERGPGGAEDSVGEFQPDRLLAVVAELGRVSSSEICSRSKSVSAVRAREMLILVGLELGANRSKLAEISGLSGATVSRRYDAARRKLNQSRDVRRLAARIRKRYLEA